MEQYSNVLSSIVVNRMKLKNRIVMPPMGTNFANLDGSMSDEHIMYYEQRAKGGTGLITLENSCVDYPMGTNGTTQLRIDSDQFVPELYKFNEAMHKHGAMTCVQINHAGASAYIARLNNETPVSSSNIPSKANNPIPRPLSVDEIKEIVIKYGQAAARARQAGFDSVEIHAGHTYLLSQFLSPIYNKREDEFGGSPENRARFAKMVVEEVRKQVGPFFPISIRISAVEFLDGGNSLEESIELAKHFVEKVDIINVSSALNDSIQYQIDQMNLADGWRSYMAKAYKEVFSDKIIMTSGNVRNPLVADKIIENNEADLIAMGRGLIADPNWVNKIENNQANLLRKCISCNIGCADHRISKSKPIRCTINPNVINEESDFDYKVTTPMKLAVIGGGSVALEAALSAAKVGVDVKLFEQKSYLGGLAREIARFPDKKRIDDFITYQENMADTYDNLEIYLNHCATAKDIEDYNPDIILNATGALPLLPPIAGLHAAMEKEDTKVLSIFDLLNDLSAMQDIQNKDIAVVGGGAVGLDVVEYFAQRMAKSITIIEMQDQLGKDLDFITKIAMNKMVEDSKVNVLSQTALKHVNDTSFMVERDGKSMQIDFDYGFVCLGMRANAPLESELEKYARTNNIEYVNYGDSKMARRIFEGVNEARGIINVIKKQEEKMKGSL